AVFVSGTGPLWGSPRTAKQLAVTVAYLWPLSAENGPRSRGAPAGEVAEVELPLCSPLAGRPQSPIKRSAARSAARSSGGRSHELPRDADRPHDSERCPSGGVYTAALR